MIIFLCSSATTGLLAEGVAPQAASLSEGYVEAEVCLGCHEQEASQWQGSDHSWAMRHATADNVLGDFSDVVFRDGDVEARFFKRDDRFYVNTEGPDGSRDDFEIAYTFGYSPLQQYLIEFPGGRLQSLTIAWDSRSAEKGGQRWFSLYPGEHFSAQDPLHWTGRYQNWNAMCADCHSTDLHKNYDEKTDTFATTWKELDVGCQSCHGPGQKHVAWAQDQEQGGGASKSSYMQESLGLTVDLAELDPEAEVELCASCHSHRQSLIESHAPEDPLLDSALPSVLTDGLYHADGQVEGEVFVYGSYVQSKMYAEGVRCTDCHNPHTTETVIEGNGLCVQCHNPSPPKARFPSLQAKDYDTPEHHRHPAGSAGAQCVNCHMPNRTFMRIDKRRDHSIRIPRPDLSARTGSPDACTACHEERDPQWAAAQLASWFGEPDSSEHYGEVLALARGGSEEAFAPLARLIADATRPAVVRATAAAELERFGELAKPVLSSALQDPQPLVRAYAATAFERMPMESRIEELVPLLEDSRQAVRDRALSALADVPSERLPVDLQASIQGKLKDYEQRLRANADLPGGRHQLAVFLEKRGRRSEAIKHYRMTLQLDPHLVAARLDLAVLLSQREALSEAESVLRKGINLEGVTQEDRGQLGYRLALLLAGKGETQAAQRWLKDAARALPDNARVRYNLGLLLLQSKQLTQAESVLEEGINLTPQDPDMLYAMIYLHLMKKDVEGSLPYVERLRRVAPEDPRLKALEANIFGN